MNKPILKISKIVVGSYTAYYIENIFHCSGFSSEIEEDAVIKVAREQAIEDRVLYDFNSPFQIEVEDCNLWPECTVDTLMDFDLEFDLDADSGNRLPLRLSELKEWFKQQYAELND